MLNIWQAAVKLDPLQRYTSPYTKKCFIRLHSQLLPGAVCSSLLHLRSKYNAARVLFQGTLPNIFNHFLIICYLFAGILVSEHLRNLLYSQITTVKYYLFTAFNKFNKDANISMQNLLKKKKDYQHLIIIAIIINKRR